MFPTGEMSVLSRAGHERPPSARPAQRRRALASAGLAVPVALVVAVAGSNATPLGLDPAAGTATVTGWRAVAGSGADLDGAAQTDLGDVIVRASPERAARAATLTAETTRRAATEAALAANEQVKTIATVPPPKPAWQRPLDGGYTLTSGFGARWGKLHPAQDFAVAEGTPVKAPSNGTVTFAGWNGNYGYKVEIQLWDGTVAWFAHNSALGVTQGQSVVTGQVIAASGNTGHSTGPHVHMEIHPGGADPVPVMEWLAAQGIPM